MTDARNTPAPCAREILVHPRYRADIDGLRAIAVLAVVGFHAFPESVRGGFVGVDVFFVISGFLISSMIFESLDQGRFSFAAFYAGRVRRIFPALILVLVVGWILGWMYLLPGDFKQLGKHIVGGAGFAANLVLWKESGYFDQTAVMKPFLHLWSLGIEEQFYILMPFLWYLAWRFRLGLVRITLLLAAISFALNLALIRHDPIGVFYSPVTRIWEILLGSLLASAGPGREMAISGRLKAWSAAIPDNFKSLAGLVLVAFSVLAMHKQQAFPGWRALLPAFGAGLIVAAGPHAWLNRQVLANRLLVWLGLISYPLYLWHWLLLSFLAIVVLGRDAPPVEVGFVVVLLSVLLAGLTYVVVERPMRSGKHGTVILLCIAMIGVAILGGIAWGSVGIESRSRFDRAIVKLTSRDEAFHQAWRIQIRQGQCHLDEAGANFGDCIERNRRPLVFLWGDSFAATLYPGLKALQKKEMFGIAQFTASSCPPLPDYYDSSAGGRRNCPEINKKIMATIRSSMPDVVILHANWAEPVYGLYDRATKKIAFGKLSETVKQLQAAGIRRIVLIGPVPNWVWYLSDMLLAEYREDTLHRFPPLRSGAVYDDFKFIDASMSQLASETHIDFVSASSVLCNEEGCLTRFGDDYSSLETLDSGHLTPLASQYLIERIAGSILPPGPGQLPR